MLVDENAAIETQAALNQKVAAEILSAVSTRFNPALVASVGVLAGAASLIGFAFWFSRVGA